MTLEVRVPQLPESVADATLVAWHKKVGDAVVRDENLADRNYSATTAIAGMLTFALAAYAMVGDMRAAGAAAAGSRAA